jgi:hypothetical protein
MTSRRNRKPLPPVYAQPVYAQPSYSPRSPSVYADVLSSKNATVARVRVVKVPKDFAAPLDYEFEVSDSSKREQGDRYDEQAGELLALGRAFQRLGRELLSAGSKRTREVLAEQQAEREALEAKRSTPRQPVHRRTREEWETVQKAARRQEKKARYAELWGSPGVEWREDSEVRGEGVKLRWPSGTGVNQLTDNLGLTLESHADLASADLADEHEIDGTPHEIPLKGGKLVIKDDMVQVVDTAGRPTFVFGRVRL